MGKEIQIMSEYKLSILIPGIRNSLWRKVYDSISKSCLQSWEVIFVGPYPLPDELKDKKNVQYFQDWGSPTRCRQIALIHSKGEYINFAADDVEFFEYSLECALLKIEKSNYRKVLVGKYSEGNKPEFFPEEVYQWEMINDNYYYLMHHSPLHQFMWHYPKDYKLFNTGIIERQFLVDMGGWDCRFECCALACVDLSMRLQNTGCEMEILPRTIFKSTHLDGPIGDHQPIHDGQTQKDFPLLYSLYVPLEGNRRMAIDIDNWKQASERWERRFGKA
jgi:hypothetical protein